MNIHYVFFSYHTDHLGSYDVITTDNKVVTERYHFDPWGNRKNPTNWTATDTRTSFFSTEALPGTSIWIPLRSST